MKIRICGLRPRGTAPLPREVGFLPCVSGRAFTGLVDRYGRDRSLGSRHDAAEWSDGYVVRGEIHSLKTNGDYEVVLEFQDAELKNWLKNYIHEKPAKALKLLAEVLPEFIETLR